MNRPIVSFHPTIAADINLLLTSQRPLDEGDRIAVKHAAAVLLPLVCRPDLHALAAEAGRPHFPRPGAHLKHDGKVGNHRLFSSLGLAQPPTMEFPGIGQAVAAWQSGRLAQGGLTPPLVAKGAGGGMGDNVFLVHSPGELAALKGRLETHCARGPSGLVLQSFIDTGCRDARVIMVGGYEDAFWRVGPPGEFRSNLSQGGRIERPRNDARLGGARDLARSLKQKARFDVAAVDVLCPRGGEPVLLEINFFFGREAVGGNKGFAEIYLNAVKNWLAGLGLDPGRVRWDG